MSTEGTGPMGSDGTDEAAGRAAEGDRSAPEPPTGTVLAGPGRLAILKALGDNTRYAIYLEVARSPVPRSTAEVADALGLHPNTVRPHLERMREVGLLEVETAGRGGVGRPQHRWSTAPEAPSLGLEPPAFPLLAQLLAGVAALAGAGPEEAVEVGRAQGRRAAARRAGRPCVDALLAELSQLGFDPEVATDEGGTTVAFTHCPYADLAAAHPDLVCQLHRGLVEGMLEGDGGPEITRFRTLVDRQPCRVELAAG